MDAALEAYQAGDYAKCADTLTAMQGQVPVLPQGVDLFYVECLAAAGRIDEAFAYVRRELPNGRIDLAELKSKDRPGLNRLRASAGWAPALAEAAKLEADRQAKIDQPLRDELVARGAKDQAVRQQAIDEGGDARAWEQTAAVDRDNAAWLKGVVAEKGWPTLATVGHDGAQAAFLIAQHASFDQAFQEQVLVELEAAVERKEAEPGDLALLTDRVLRQQGKPQVYGTQFTFNEDGSMSMQPTADPDGLDDRRASMGLPPIAEYRKSLSEIYRRPVK
ncbi:hypothetical protein CSC64_02105 [Pseudoxanthomonas koreensis]|nr:hypothetical protein CSC64_02105 [Pseudoxanthomonas koreensis]